jgi:large subunit ribosomal protein L4e
MAQKNSTVKVFDVKTGKDATSVALPDVYGAPIRADIVHKVHTNMNKNKRQAYAVAEKAGMSHSAESWGTGRAVARIPRISGGGTSRSGQGAFGNMCRKGRMFAPTKTWRKWHKESNLNERRVAVCSAIAASAVPGLVMARGHKVDSVSMLPLVVSGLEDLEHSSKALAALKSIGAFDDIERVQDSKKIRSGKGKMRNRRYVQRRGPLLVHIGSSAGEPSALERGFRNILGIELAVVSRLNLLQLAPGGHLGRFIIWTDKAFAALNAIFGTYGGQANAQATGAKTKFRLPQSIMANADVARIINSNEVQSKVNAKKTGTPRAQRKQNPLTNHGALLKLNPHAKVSIRAGIKGHALGRVQKKKVVQAGQKPAVKHTRAQKRSFLKTLQTATLSTAGQRGEQFLASFDYIRSTTQSKQAQAAQAAKPANSHKKGPAKTAKKQ